MKAKNVAKRSSRVIDSESSSDDGDEIKIIFDEDSMDDVVMFQCIAACQSQAESEEDWVACIQCPRWYHR